MVLLLSDFQAPDYDKPLRVTARRHDLVALPIVDPRELEIPDVGRIVLEDAETGEHILVNSSDRRTRVRYAEAIGGWHGELPAAFLRHGVDTITLQTNQDYVPALRQFFQRREHRLPLG